MVPARVGVYTHARMGGTPSVKAHGICHPHKVAGGNDSEPRITLRGGGSATFHSTSAGSNTVLDPRVIPLTARRRQGPSRSDSSVPDHAAKASSFIPRSSVSALHVVQMTFFLPSNTEGMERSRESRVASPRWGTKCPSKRLVTRDYALSAAPFAREASSPQG